MGISHRAKVVSSPLTVYFDYLTPDIRGYHTNVVMVHGGRHTGSCYLVTAEGKPGWAYRFEECSYHVAVPDWRGHGRSGALDLKTLTGEQICQSFTALISSLDGPVVLLTHSMGVPWARGLPSHVETRSLPSLELHPHHLAIFKANQRSFPIAKRDWYFRYKTDRRQDLQICEEWLFNEERDARRCIYVLERESRCGSTLAFFTQLSEGSWVFDGLVS